MLVLAFGTNLRQIGGRLASGGAAGSNTAGGCAAAVAGRPEWEADCPGQAARPGGRPLAWRWSGIQEEEDMRPRKNKKGIFIGSIERCFFAFFFEVNDEYIKLASRLIKNLPVPLGTLVRKRVRLKLAAPIKIRLHRL
jgi:hypothetical protein